MFKKLLLISLPLFFAFLILSLSIVRTSQNIYTFKGPINVLGVYTEAEKEIDYFFVYPGKILPDNSLWGLKVFRDKLWLWGTSNPQKKAELLLLFADKRLVSSRILFENEKSEVAFSTLTKAEKYLEEAHQQTKINRAKGVDTLPFEQILVIASLKHLEEMKKMLIFVPEDCQPQLIKTMDYPNGVYHEVSNYLLEKGILPPVNPFN